MQTRAPQTAAPETAAVQAAQGRIGSCGDLVPGMVVEARIRGAWHFAGEVAEIQPALGLFWAVSETGERRIIELDEYEVYRLG